MNLGPSTSRRAPGSSVSGAGGTSTLSAPSTLSALSTSAARGSRATRVRGIRKQGVTFGSGEVVPRGALLEGKLMILKGKK